MRSCTRGPPRRQRPRRCQNLQVVAVVLVKSPPSITISLSFCQHDAIQKYLKVSLRCLTDPERFLLRPHFLCVNGEHTQRKLEPEESRPAPMPQTSKNSVMLDFSHFGAKGAGYVSHQSPPKRASACPAFLWWTKILLLPGSPPRSLTGTGPARLFTGQHTNLANILASLPSDKWPRGI